MGALLAWLAANVPGNLVASLIWTVPALAWHYRRITRRQRDELRKLRIQLSAEIASLRLANTKAGSRLVSLRDLVGPDPRMPDTLQRPPGGSGGDVP